MFYCLLIAFMALIVLLDQVVKAVVSANIALGEVIPAIPGLFHWTHFHNTGAAFSMLQGGRWLFAAVCLIGLGVTVILVWKKVLTNRGELWCLAAIFGGGIGNLIDRLRLGYVVDMIEVEFMDFAVFNIADAFISCGAVALVVYVLFFERAKKPKEEANHDPEA